MTKLTLGKLNADHPLGFCDAVHMPCVVVISKKVIHPGDRLVFTGHTTVTKAQDEIFQAVADPFLEEPVQPLELFIAMVCPHLVTALTHAFEISGVPDNFASGSDDDDSGDDWCNTEGC